MIAMTAPLPHQPIPFDDDLSTTELARRQGIKPIMSVDELADPDAFESDDEVDAFLADLYAARRANIG
jgi:hypothetical protein